MMVLDPGGVELGLQGGSLTPVVTELWPIMIMSAMVGVVRLDENAGLFLLWVHAPTKSYDI